MALTKSDLKGGQRDFSWLQELQIPWIERCSHRLHLVRGGMKLVLDRSIEGLVVNEEKGEMYGLTTDEDPGIGIDVS